MLRFDERVHLPKNRENTITFLVNGEPIGTVETLVPGAKTVDIPIPPVDYDSVTDALGYIPYDSTNPSGYITSSALANYVTTNTNQTITAVKSFHNAELLTDNFITLNGTTAYLRGQSGINYYNLMNLNNSGITVGSVNQPIKIVGNATRPKYNSNDLALYSDISTVTVDQVYDGTSANAQSGIAIANAGFLTGINSTDVTNALGYTPVNKVGDTMSGDLTIKNNSLPTLFIEDENNSKVDYFGIEIKDNSFDVASTTAPATTINSCRLVFRDKNGTSSAWVQNRHTAGDDMSMTMGMRRTVNGTDTISQIVCGVRPSGTAYCNFPNSYRVDGQWIVKNTAIATTVTWDATSHSSTKNYSLSSYLPNDDYDYEVIIRANGTTASTSGKWISVGITSDIITTQAFVCRCRTRTASTQNCAGTIILPVGSGRRISVAGTTDASSDGTYDIRCLGYRRIGLNA